MTKKPDRKNINPRKQKSSRKEVATEASLETIMDDKIVIEGGVEIRSGLGNSASSDHHSLPNDQTKRDFLSLAATATLGIGAACAIVPLISSMNPSKDVAALSSVEVDISALQPGQEMKVKWRGKPVFIKRRTETEIAEVRKVPLGDLRDPESDEERIHKGKDEYLIVIGVCTHLGCVPLGNDSGDYQAWFCPCHGSHYDNSGRVRKGPAPKNLAVPEYKFLSDTLVQIG